MRILVVAEQYPWPAIDGYRRRLDHMVRGLAKVGKVDVVALHREGTADPVDPAIHGVNAIPVESGSDTGLKSWLGPWLRSGAPRRVLGPNWTALVDILSEFGDVNVGPYDLVWYSHVDSWFGVHEHVEATAAIVDFDNLENIALRLRRRVPPRFPPDASASQRLRIASRWVSSRAFDLLDERRWDRLQRRCASTVDRVVVCSELDLGRVGCSNAVVIGNGADAPADVDSNRRALRGAVPTMLFIGALDYEPNTEAVEWFVREVFPLVRSRVQGARVRIVGRGRSSVGWVEGVEGVELVGAVGMVEPELELADVSIVPVRVGAGTRLKVVEALANHIPMVTTSIGCEGIHLVDGEHAVIADDAESFADGCARLLVDGELRQRLADAGAHLFGSSYDWRLIEELLARLVISATDGKR